MRPSRTIQSVLRRREWNIPERFILEFCIQIKHGWIHAMFFLHRQRSKMPRCRRRCCIHLIHRFPPCRLHLLVFSLLFFQHPPTPAPSLDSKYQNNNKKRECHCRDTNNDIEKNEGGFGGCIQGLITDMSCIEFGISNRCYTCTIGAYFSLFHIHILHATCS